MKKLLENCWLCNRKYGYLLVFVLFFSKAEAQMLNLVKDPSFEDTTSTMQIYAQLSLNCWKTLVTTKV